jgi:hypothetical protein
MQQTKAYFYQYGEFFGLDSTGSKPRVDPQSCAYRTRQGVDAEIQQRSYQDKQDRAVQTDVSQGVVDKET